MPVNESALAEDFIELCKKHGAAGGIIYWNREVEMACCICAFNEKIGELLNDVQAAAEQSFLMRHPEVKIELN